MRRFQLTVVLLVMAVVAAGCGGDSGDEASDGDDVGATQTSAGGTTASVPTTVAGTTLPPRDLTLRITDVRLVNSEESDSGMRILLPAGVASASVTLTGLPSPNRVISVCQANDLERRLAGASCRTPANGEAVTVQLGAAASGVEIVQAGVAGPGPGGNSAALESVTVRYAAGSRELNMRLAQIAAGEEGGRPVFTLTPAGTDGAYRATLSWSVIPVFGGTPAGVQLEVVQGGNVINQVQGGGGEVRLTGNVPTPVTDAAIRIQNTGGAALVTPKLSALLP